MIQLKDTVGLVSPQLVVRLIYVRVLCTLCDMRCISVISTR